MIQVTPDLAIDENEIKEEFIRASGPGGQNVNKTASKAQLRFNINSPTISDEVKDRLYKIAGKRINEQGELIIEAQRFRTQEQNRQDAVERLVRLLRLVLYEPRARQKTRPTSASRQRRLDSKKRRSETKHLRRRLHSGANDSDGDYS